MFIFTRVYRYIRTHIHTYIRIHTLFIYIPLTPSSFCQQIAIGELYKHTHTFFPSLLLMSLSYVMSSLPYLTYTYIHTHIHAHIHTHAHTNRKSTKGHRGSFTRPDNAIHNKPKSHYCCCQCRYVYAHVFVYVYVCMCVCVYVHVYA